MHNSYTYCIDNFCSKSIKRRYQICVNNKIYKSICHAICYHEYFTSLSDFEFCDNSTFTSTQSTITSVTTSSTDTSTSSTDTSTSSTNNSSNHISILNKRNHTNVNNSDMSNKLNLNNTKAENNYLIYIFILCPIVGICIIVLILKCIYRKKTKKNCENKIQNSNNLQENIPKTYNNPIYEYTHEFINDKQTTSL